MRGIYRVRELFSFSRELLCPDFRAGSLFRVGEAGASVASVAGAAGASAGAGAEQSSSIGGVCGQIGLQPVGGPELICTGALIRSACSLAHYPAHGPQRQVLATSSPVCVCVRERERTQ